MESLTCAQQEVRLFQQAKASPLHSASLPLPLRLVPLVIGCPSETLPSPDGSMPSHCNTTQGLLKVPGRLIYWAGTSRGRRTGGLSGSSAMTSPGLRCLLCQLPQLRGFCTSTEPSEALSAGMGGALRQSALWSLLPYHITVARGASDVGFWVTQMFHSLTFRFGISAISLFAFPETAQLPFYSTVQWNHACFGIRGVSKRTGSNSVHGPIVGWASSLGATVS
ncbi:hypothetical protein E2C01_053236 [Portunus trituberculatus]|uniref:Uncharacterized protein n=1 Tax=Portunus trituberculatus TaxID=210409 RepID=A0A5B7GQ84_PORTR|nr:hypothetical protein [Portunus trituberculatus]